MIKELLSPTINILVFVYIYSRNNMAEVLGVWRLTLANHCFIQYFHHT